ncbi:hypothetical protein [Vibrio sp. Y20_XG_PY13]|uniref:hypothetical protein n=1 Tax=Vibrio sp. Y20_XG_PY13 TaxID=2957761 RepID=UPI00346219D6
MTFFHTRWKCDFCFNAITVFSHAHAAIDCIGNGQGRRGVACAITVGIARYGGV